MAGEQENLSDVGVEFSVFYDISQGTVLLKVKNHTRAAHEHGVKYQILYEPQGETARISPPMIIEEARSREFRCDILRGDAIAVRVIDPDDRHLAAAKIDQTQWPSAVNTSPIVEKGYTLYVPRERLG